MVVTKACFPLDEFVRANRKKVGRTVRIFSPVNFNQSRCRILVFASHRANEVAKWKMGLIQKQNISIVPITTLVTSQPRNLMTSAKNVERRNQTDT